MALVFFALVLAVVSIQVPNLLGMNAASGAGLTIAAAVKIALMTLPIGIVAATCFTLFYGRGSLHFSYPMLALMNQVAVIVFAVIVQVIWLQSRSTSFIEISGIMLAIIGTCMALFHQELSQFFGAK